MLVKKGEMITWKSICKLTLLNKGWRNKKKTWSYYKTNIIIVNNCNYLRNLLNMVTLILCTKHWVYMYDYLYKYLTLYQWLTNTKQSAAWTSFPQQFFKWSKKMQFDSFRRPLTNFPFEILHVCYYFSGTFSGKTTTHRSGPSLRVSWIPRKIIMIKDVSPSCRQAQLIRPVRVLSQTSLIGRPFVITLVSASVKLFL